MGWHLFFFTSYSIYTLFLNHRIDSKLSYSCLCCLNTIWTPKSCSACFGRAAKCCLEPTLEVLLCSLAPSLLSTKTALLSVLIGAPIQTSFSRLLASAKAQCIPRRAYSWIVFPRQVRTMAIGTGLSSSCSGRLSSFLLSAKLASCFIQHSVEEYVLDVDVISDHVLRINAHRERGRSCSATSLFLFGG